MFGNTRCSSPCSSPSSQPPSARRAPRLDRDDLIAAFRDADFETGMRAADLWPAGWE